MPRIAEGLYAQYYDSVLKLAKRETGVSRPELMDKLGMSRIIADRVIEKVGLKPVAVVGRTEFFKTPDTIPPAVIVHSTATSKPKKGKGTPVSAPEPPDSVGEEIQGLDKQIVEVRKMIAADCAEKAKIESRLIAHQALLTALLSQHLSS
jgi:hypothetical protein